MPNRPTYLRIAALFLLGNLFLTGCNFEPQVEFDNSGGYYELELPAGFPEMPIPEDNPLLNARVNLGRKLFYDPLLSKDSTISCASCHLQTKGFADPDPVSTGVGGAQGFRNSPAIVNLAWHEVFFRDGGVPTLELQVLAPVEAEEEMHLNFVDLTARLRQHPDYPREFWEVFRREPDPFGVTRALGAFQRTMISGNSPYDQFVHQGKADALNASEQRGLALFQSSKTNCSSCHNGFDLRREGFENNGLYAVYADSGRTRVTLDPADRGKFKIPSLRNVEVTAPYMHDGSLNSLDEVLDHYVSGGKGHVNQSELIQGFTLSTQERADLLAFLRSLTDDDFLTDPRFSDPFE